MPVDITSRYSGSPVAEAPDRSGATHPTLALRLVTSLSPATFSHRLITLETLELIAWKQYNNSAYWWRIADANAGRFPLDWTAGDAISLPTADQVGFVQRTRKF